MKSDSNLEEFAKLYFKAKKELFEAEKYSGIVSCRVLVSFRNALDDFMVSLIFHGEKWNSAKEHLWRVMYDAWIDSAWLQITKLEKRLGSLGVSGPLDEAKRLLDNAKREWTEARYTFSSDPEKAVELAKSSALNATRGLSIIHIAPRIVKISIAVAIIGVLLTLFSIVLRLMRS